MATDVFVMDYVIATEVRTYLQKLTDREALAAIEVIWDTRADRLRIVLKGRN